MNIGDLLLRVLADDSGFQADLVKKAEKAGDAAGATLGQRMAAAVKANGTAIIGGALAGGLALMGKGITELQNVTANFRAETGASADEADRAAKAILEMSSRNIQPLAEIGAALTVVHTDLGLTGDEAERVTQQFLTFGRATRQDASSAVLAFDDILDAWGLTAKDATGLMDKLVVSHQRYGGSVVENQQALATLAPQLRALNLNVDDGIALLNLFAASGIDSSKAQTALNTAILKMPPGSTFDSIILKLSAIADPAERARQAVEIFGAKAGVALANILQPGITSLDAFGVSTDDAAGATDAAADALDSTWGARFQLLIKRAGSAIVGLGNDFGGLATVIATATTVLGHFGGAKLVDALTGGLTGAWKKVAASSAVTQAVAFASGKATTLYLAALIAGDAIGGALSKAWAATGARLLAAAGIAGAASGTAFAVAAAAAIVAAPLLVLFVALKISSDIEQQGEDLKKQTAAWLKSLPADPDLQNAIKGVQEQFDAIPINLLHDKEIVGDVLNQLIAESNKRAGQVVVPLATMATQGAGAFDRLGGASARARLALETSARAMAVAARALTERLLGELLALITGYYDPLIAQQDLLVQADEVAANRRAVAAAKAALAKTTAGTAERADAKLTYDQSVLTLTQSEANLDQTKANLLAAGQLSTNDQKVWLADLQKRYKTATGDARAKIQALIDKIHQLQRVPDTVVSITVQKNTNKGTTGGAEILGSGGPVKAGVPVIVGDAGRPELFVPEVDGRIVPKVPSLAARAGSPGGDWNITLQMLEPRAGDPFQVAQQLRRLADFGMLAPRG